MKTPSFDDGFGHRVVADDASGQALESLLLCDALASAPSTEKALRERIVQLAPFSHPSFRPTLRVEPRADGTSGLVVVSEASTGVRLSEVLSRAERAGVAPSPEAALGILQQVVTAVAALHQHVHGASHGTLGPERIVVRADGSVVVTETVLAAALEPLRLSRGDLWERFRVPVPSTAGTSRFDQVTDVLQLGMLAVALIVGRLLRVEDIQPHRLPGLLEAAAAPHGGSQGFSRSLRAWIARALMFESRLAFRSAPEMDRALAAAVAEDSFGVSGVAPVREYLLKCVGGDVVAQGETGVAVEPAAVPRPAPPSGLSPRDAESRPASGPVRVMPSRTQSADPEKSGPVPVRAAGRTPSGGIPVARTVPPASDLRLPARPGGGGAAGRRVRRWAMRAARVAAVTLTLTVIWGAAFLGARSVLGFPNLLDRTGTLVVDSQPSGVELLVNGSPQGRTPATLKLRAGEYTLALRTAKSTTLVPVTVVAGGHQFERVEIRSGARKPRRTSTRQPAR